MVGWRLLRLQQALSEPRVVDGGGDVLLKKRLSFSAKR
jgi:hypothetical protein